MAATDGQVERTDPPVRRRVPVFQHWSGKKLPMRPGVVIALYPDGDGGYRRLSGSLEIHGIQVPLREPGSPSAMLFSLLASVENFAGSRHRAPVTSCCNGNGFESISSPEWPRS